MRKFPIIPFLLVFAVVFAPKTAFTQTTSELDEVFLDFRFQQLVNTPLVVYAKDGTFFIPVEELFGWLLVFTNINWEQLTITGYIGNSRNSYVIDLKNYQYQYKTNSGRLTEDDFIIDQFDIYLSVEAFYKIFDMEFDVNMTFLTMRLFTTEPLQIRLRQERNLARQRRQAQTGIIDFHEPHVPRSPKFFQGGFIDYNINVNSQNFDSQSTVAGFTAGTEFIHGDLQTNFSLSNSSFRGTNLNWGNTRWRYYRPDGFVRQIIAGDLQSRGIAFNQPLRGLSVTNEPLYRSRVFDEFNLAETAPPYSEIEIFINDRLFEFLYVDESGEYQIRLPITYGVNDIRIVTYSPDGRISEVKQRLNIPFYFVPPKEFYYTAYLGQTRTSGFNPDPFYVNLIDFGYGINRNSTIRAKTEVVQGPDDLQSAILGEYSRRFFDGVIGTVQYSPSRLVTGNLSYQTRFNSFFNASVSHYDTAFQEVNNGIRYRYAANAFVGLPVRLFPMFLRGGVDLTDFGNLQSNTIDATLTSRINRVSVSGGFRNLNRVSATSTSRLTSFDYTLSYSTPRTQNFPAFARGIFFRLQISALEQPLDINRYNIAMSRSIFNSGQIQANYTHFNATGRGTFFISFSFDIPYARFNTSVRGNRDNIVYNQSIRGSVGYFPNDNIFLFDNRNQVGRSAVAFKSFVDSDGSGSYTPGEQVLNFNAMRIVGAGARVFQVKDRVLITQLRQYERYNVEVNEAMIQDPSLVALNRRFSITTDPNQFKYIEVPYSRAGIAEGFVFMNRQDRREGLGGVTIRIVRTDDSLATSARTFFDGSFYKDELIPGNYIAYPDSNQLRILQARSEPEVFHFEVKSSEFGDIVDLGFDLFPLHQIILEPPPAPEPEPASFRVQTAVMNTLPQIILAGRIAERATGVGFEFQYSPATNNYRLFSTELTAMDEVNRVLGLLHTQTDFTDAFVITDETYSSIDLMFSVQIGAQRTRALANRHADIARERYGLNVQIVEDLRDGMFKIQTTPSLNWTDVQLLLNNIRTETEFWDAFVLVPSLVTPSSFIFSVQVAAYSREAMAISMRDEFIRRTGMPFEVSFNRNVGLYVVSIRNIPQWSVALQMYDTLIEEHGLQDVIINFRRR